MAVCAYCYKDTKLQCSHAIPDAIFKSISRQYNGKLIAIPKGTGKIYLTQETGKADLLCQTCEREFNKKFDSPLVNALKQWDMSFIGKGAGATLNFPADQMAQGLASIFWRASASGNAIYADAKVIDYDKNRLLKVVSADQKDALRLCSCSIWRLHDKQSPKDGGFAQGCLSQVILPVNAYKISWGKARETNAFAFATAFNGFIYHLMIPRLPYKARKQPGYLRTGSNRLRAPMKYFADYRPLMDAMVSGMEKHLTGQSNLKE